MWKWVIALLAAWSPVSAATVQFTFTGVVFDRSFQAAIDGSGIFGPAGTSLAGDQFTLVIVYDTANGGAFGGAGTGGTTISPDITSSMTINGITRVTDYANSISNGSYSQAAYYYPSDSSVLRQIKISTGANRYNNQFLNSANAVLNVDVDIPVSEVGDLTLGPDFSANLLTGCDELNVCGGEFLYDGFSTTGGLDIKTFDISEPAFVTPSPEPMTWALMLVGFAVLGLMTRQKSASAAAS